ncbi:MAG: UDP binding domain-containing protein, partial [Bacteroides sp.]
DPVASSEALRVLEREHGAANVETMLTIVSSAAAATEGADALVLVTEWKEFRLPVWGVVKKTMKQLIVIDGRNIYDKKELEELGFVYHCIGR